MSESLPPDHASTTRRPAEPTAARGPAEPTAARGPAQPAAGRGRPPEPTEELQRLGVRLGVEELGPGGQDHENTRATGIESVVPGQVVETPYGSCFVVETHYPLEHIHGGHRLSALPPAECPSPVLARLAGDESLTGLDFKSAIFFDIETTGLGIGSGMYAFMVGLGTFEGDQFCLRQYFMRDYSEEEALLHVLEEQIQGSGWWVSFNGRNFDLPVLQTRFICGGYREMPLAQAPHLDLLYPARRLWRKRLASCALSSLETNILGLIRESDVPGWMIPGLYFDYLRYGEAQPLRQVFVHNAWDILSLVTLTAKVNQMLCDPFGETLGHATDGYSLGMIYESLGQREEAQRAYEQALRERLPPDLHEDALCRLSFVYKRTGQIERAVQIWEALREEGEAYAYVELAKYYEHRQRDYLRAAKLVCEALALDGLPAKGQCSPHELKHRLTRLRRKLGEGGLPMPHIESYSFGRITIDSTTYTEDLIILPGGVRPGWWRKKGHSLHKEDLQEVIEARPSVLVIGTGNVGGMQVPQETLDYLAAHGIRAEVQRTAAACQRYNELAKAEQVAAALHLTC
jgi:uncharacterized protein YprB with RNaseH-like and TPR domain